MNAHPKPSVVNDDGQRWIARDEPSVLSEQPQPGAFPIPGSDGRRRNSNCRCRSRSDASLEGGDREPSVVHPRRRAVLRNDGADSTTVLVPEADLVLPGDDVPLVEGQAIVELSAAERKRKQRRGSVLLCPVLSPGGPPLAAVLRPPGRKVVQARTRSSIMAVECDTPSKRRIFFVLASEEEHIRQTEHTNHHRRAFSRMFAVQIRWNR